jgi:putative ABC transport system permease protein
MRCGSLAHGTFLPLATAAPTAAWEHEPYRQDMSATISRLGRSPSRIVSSVLGSDLKYAVRTLLGSPGFSLTVILTFGLGIGLNTAVFSLIHSIVLEPLPFPGGERMVQLWRYEETQGRGAAIVPPARAMVAAWQEEDRVFDAVAGYAEEEFHLAVGDDVFSVMGVRVSPGILSLVSARPLLGRLFGSGDGLAGSNNVVLLSEQIRTASVLTRT